MFVEVTDESDGLKVYHFNDCTVESPKELQQMRHM